MRSEDDRHATKDTNPETKRASTRIAFEGLVEVGGALGPAFEAQAIDVSDEGMHLRTAYLPDIGQRVSCRFDAGPNGTVLASGEVVWRREEGRGGEFGLRFEDLDDESAQALRHITGAAVSVTRSMLQEPGSKVRLHIEGLGSPMRAKVKSSKDHAVTVGSELGFLRVGKDVELEDASSGDKRPARIDRVEVEVDDSSKVPNLVVTLRYSDVAEAAADVEAEMAASAASDVSHRTPGPSELAGERTARTGQSSRASHASVKAPSAARAKMLEDDDDLEAIKRASGGLKGAFARGAAQMGPAITKFAKRAQVTVALLAERAKGGVKDDLQMPIRRTTAPAPGGGLHTSGRKVVRGDAPGSELDDGYLAPRTKLDKRKLAIGGAIGAAVLLAAIAMRKPATPPTASAEAVASADALAAAPPALPAALAAPADPLAAGATPGGFAPPAGATAMTMPPATISPTADVSEPDDEAADGKGHKRARRAVVAPFSNGPVAHGNVLKLKMDGAIEKIQGASQPTGFTVVVPNRRSLEAAGPLAARDSRIASIRVTNDPNGAELSVTFKDGVPNYLVRSKGDTLEIALASMGALADAKPESKATSGHLPGKHADAKHTGKKRPHAKTH